MQCPVLWWRADRIDLPLSLRISPTETVDAQVADQATEARLSSARSVWLRDPSPDLGDLERALDEEDAYLAHRELNFLRTGVLHLAGLVGSDRLWANPIRSIAGCSKAAQLMLAQQVGLAVPATLITNDVVAARRFVAEAGRPVIFKPHELFHWIDTVGQTVRRVSPRLVTVDELDDAQALRLSPGIFQHYVRKVHELRVTVFGSTCIAAEVRNQDPLDWRSVLGITFHPFELPPSIEAWLVALVRQLGLTMGMCDLVVDERGEYNFLEVNQQGQFLFLEEQNRDIRLLEPFARFLASGDAAFDARQCPDVGIRFRGYVDSGAHAAMMPDAGPFEPDHVATPRNRFRDLLQSGQPAPQRGGA